MDSSPPSPSSPQPDDSSNPAAFSWRTPPGFAPSRPPQRRGSFLWVALGLFLTLVVPSTVLLAAMIIAQPQATPHDSPIFSMNVSGTVYGEDAARREAGYDALAPVIGATVSCGSASAVTDAYGRYSLSQLRGSDFTCLVIASQYITMVTKVQPQRNGSYTLDFGSPSATMGSGSCVSTSASQRCGALTLELGTISGTVVDRVTRKPVNLAAVTCWDNSLAARASMKDPASYSAFSTPKGLYVMRNVPVGLYVCVVALNDTPQPVTVRPGSVASREFSICQRNCGEVTFHQGNVMHTLTLYVIFWTPPGTRLDPHMSDARFRALVSQFIQDLGGTPFYGLLTQYWDFAGPVRNVVRLGGTLVDTHPYPHAGTRASPLTEDDISGEITNDNVSQRWSLKQGASAVAIITAYGVEACARSLSGRNCSFPLNTNQWICGYHSYTSYTQDAAGELTYTDLPFMLIINVPSCNYVPPFSEAPAPYGAPNLDVVIDYLSHEIFETVSDPTMKGWYGGNTDHEIGDKCYESYGYPARDGSTVRLANGHGYVLQREWSNIRNACSYA